MRPHLQYLKYVLLHKLYVARAGVAIRGWSPRWLWRLLVHDLSKFGRAEWGPYVTTFYGPKPEVEARRLLLQPGDASELYVKETERIRRERKAAFDRAWLHHQHHNSHHWQHWLLREDSGATILLVPPADDVDEMVADWLGAGTKILARPTFEKCIGETIVWYVQNREKIQLREIARNRVEHVLRGLADDYGLVVPAMALHESARTREALTVTMR